MSVTLAGMQSFVGAGSSDEALLSECLEEAVELLRAYLRPLRTTDELGAVTGRVAATYDAAASSWTWTDSRVVDEDQLVPAVLLDRATREVCSDLFARRNAPGGIINQQFAGADPVTTGPARLHRDPLIPAYPLLSRWAVPF